MSEAVMDMYNALEEMGFTQNQIDDMDIVYHLKRLSRRKEKVNHPETKRDEPLYIDQFLG
ncbi:hypothetical protein [Bacillus atrophaeus]|uniref:hypothetical protein n=1 Tax=Bacillus atrophaeus TaxID=1452 RepID=UPI000C059593|nr:hypothetical protein [Bacillus atrophaeus]ATO28679.1 hypothetical protein RA13_12085 [Bacillus atrophaeus]MCY8517942.1 hypothetical protein [Bacillus atrophaeus]MCY8946230.1 hypothetical protein [Bacillus atrophaeus]MCY9204355.1 hypothetical protein [Bacillus atrophaeus]MDS9998610.1 hypothetical protein [Bacillus atrophaeus]